MSVDVISVAGLPTVRLNRAEFASQFLKDKESLNVDSKAKAVFSSNGQGVSLCTTDSQFKGLMLKADYIHADGMSVVYASRLKNKKGLPERIATTDLVHDISNLSTEEKPLKYFLFGGSEDVVNKAKEKLEELYPTVEIVGFNNGYVYDIEEISNRINELKPDIVWVAFGKPLQENISLILQEKIHGVTWIKTCGGLFDFLSGNSKRAPNWMQNVGLEWLHRLILRPRKLFLRYVTTNLIAIYAYFRH